MVRQAQRGSRLHREKGLVSILTALLLGAIVGLGVFYIKATRPLYYPEDEALIKRAVADAAVHFRAPEEEILRISFPIVMQLSDRTCVELRPKRADLGGYLACYRAPNSDRVEERVLGAPFGPRKFLPPLL